MSVESSTAIRGVSSSGLRDQAFSIGTSFRLASFKAKRVPGGSPEAIWLTAGELWRAASAAAGIRATSVSVG